MQSLLNTLLLFEGFAVVQLERGASLDKALDQVRGEQPDLVLLDVHLRHFNGLDLVKAIRGDPQVSSTRVLMSSGMDLNYESIQAGADGFILKPYMPDELIQEINTMIGT